ncbi:MAG: PDZ domain-containing protein [Phycisphaerales bacterium]
MFKPTLATTLLLTGLSFTQAYCQAEPKPVPPIAPPAPVQVRELLADRIQTPMVKAAFMGVTAERISEAMNSQLKLPEGVGLVVTHVVPDGPATEAGLLKHDVLNKLDDQLLINFEQFAVLIRLHKPGDSVTLSIIRGGEPMTLPVTLTEREVPEMSFDRTPHPNGWFVPNGPGPFGNATTLTPGINERVIQEKILHTLPETPFGRVDDNVIYLQNQNRYKMRIADDKHKIMINKLTDEGPVIIVEDAKGNVLHDGIWQPGEDLSSELPADVIEKIDSVLEVTTPGEPVHIRADEIEITPVPRGSDDAPKE